MKYNKTPLLISCFFLISSLVACNSYTPPPDFLDSLVSTPYGMNAFPYGEFNVKTLIDEIKKTELNDGSFPIIQGWSIKGNVYTLTVLILKNPLKLIFTHYSTQPQNISTLYLIGAGEKIDGFEIARLFPNLLDKMEIAKNERIKIIEEQQAANQAEETKEQILNEERQAVIQAEEKKRLELLNKEPMENAIKLLLEGYINFYDNSYFWYYDGSVKQLFMGKELMVEVSGGVPPQKELSELDNLNNVKIENIDWEGEVKFSFKYIRGKEFWPDPNASAWSEWRNTNLGERWEECIVASLFKKEGEWRLKKDSVIFMLHGNIKLEVIKPPVEIDITKIQ